MLADLRNKLFAHLERLSLGFYERNRAGVIISRITNDVEALDQLVTDGVTSLIQNTLLLVGTVVLFLLDARLALAMLTVLIPMALLTAWFPQPLEPRLPPRPRAARPRHGHARRGHRRHARRPVVHARARAAAGLPRRQRPPGRQLRDDDAERDLLPRRRPALVGGDGDRLRLRRLARLPRRHDRGHALRLRALPLQLLRPGPAALAAYNTFLSAIAALDKIIGVLDEKPQVVDPADAEELERIEGRVHFEGVRFGYGPEFPEVLHGLELDVPAGTTVALVGHTGAGKSTIAKLIARFYDPTEGRITIDGVDPRRG